VKYLKEKETHFISFFFFFVDHLEDRGTIFALAFLEDYLKWMRLIHFI